MPPSACRRAGTPGRRAAPARGRAADNPGSTACCRCNRLRPSRPRCPPRLSAACPGASACSSACCGGLAALLLLARRMSYAWRAAGFVGGVYVGGLALFAAVGPISQVYLLAFPVLTALLLGLRPALLALALNALGLAAFAAGAAPPTSCSSTPC
ncbi:hypothetical protein ABXN37_17390 [Piscinibacter sakaiensis]|uniref:hypothetical protein n=1 Tax=Piscinibacter sakaiensis TaxID=1547922 RepID=UPI0037270C62